MNKYLEKVSGIVHNTAGAIYTLGKNTANNVGNQFHRALGGVPHDYLQKSMGIKDPQKIMDMAESLAGRKQILQHMKANGIKNPSQHLRNETNAARISSGLIVGGGVYGGSKLLDKVHESFPSQSSYSQDDVQMQYPQYYQ